MRRIGSGVLAALGAAGVVGAVAVLGAAGVLGCATAGPTAAAREPTMMQISWPWMPDSQLRYYSEATPSSDALGAAVASAWPRLGAAYTSLGIPLTMLDTAGHALGAIRIRGPRRLAGKPLSALVDCGSTPIGSPRADSYQVTLTVVSQLRTAGTGSVLHTLIVAFATDPNGSSTAVQCGSTGTLEHMIAAAVQGAGGG